MIIQASLTHPEMVEALGHDVPRVFMLVFGGGCALAGLAGVIGGNAFVTEPGMAAAVGSIVFVVVVFGGMGSLPGAFIASLFFGAIQTFSVALDYSLLDVASKLGVAIAPDSGWRQLLSITIAQTAPVLPYLLMVLMLIVRPTGLMGTRET
jgi:branched-chain amino acid transport system permease protein